MGDAINTRSIIKLVYPACQLVANTNKVIGIGTSAQWPATHQWAPTSPHPLA